MKHILKIGIVFFAMIAMWSCENEDDKVIAQPVLEPVIVSPNSSLTLTEDAENLSAFTLVWDHADFDANTPVNYVIEFDQLGNEFQDAKIGGKTSERFYSWTVKELNDLALEKGLEGEKEGALEVQVKSFIGSDDAEPMVSNTSILTLIPYTPFTPPVDEGPTRLFFVGNATAAGWNNNNDNTPLFRSADNENQFTFTGKINGGGDLGFKFLEVKGQWAPQWGDTNGTFTARPTEADPDPSPYNVPADGYYTINIDLEATTYSREAFDVSTATDYTTIEILGDAVNADDANGDDIPDGWQIETDMMRTEFDSHIWTIKGITLGSAGLKFRANDDWDQSWGGAFPSTTSPNGDNIPVEAGTYDIWFNDITKHYIFIPAEAN